MSLETPLNRVLGLGSAKAGTSHWAAQRLTAIALVALGAWFAIALLTIPLDNYELVLEWIARPINAIGLILLVLALVYHSSLGLQVVIEDYVHGAPMIVALIVMKFVHIALAVAGVFAIVVVAVGGQGR